MNANDRNGVRTSLHDALSGKPIHLDNQRVPAEELLKAAEELKDENPEYANVQVRKIGSHRIALELGEAGV